MKGKLVIGSLVVIAGTVVAYMQWTKVGRERASEAAHTSSQPAPWVGQPKYLREIGLITDPGLHWEERIKAVRALPGKLGDDSAERLYAYLEQPPATGEEHWYLVCNEIMEVLRKRNLTPGIYTRKHLDLIQSAKSDPMIRDYAAQHLAQWISGNDPNARETNSELAASAFDAMREEAARPANGQLTLAGTTLNGLCDTVLTGSEAMKAKQNEVGSLAVKMAETNDGSVSNANRATALQVAARLKVSGLPQACRRMAADKQEAIDVRLSSIAALGLVGSEQDVALLESMHSEEAFKFAAAAAIQRLTGQSATH